MNHYFEICHYQQNVPQHYYLLDTLVIIIIIVVVGTFCKSLVVVAEHECSTNWGDCEPNKSNQMNKSNKSNKIKLN